MKKVKLSPIRAGIIGMVVSTTIVFILSIEFQVDIPKTIMTMLPAFILAAIFSLGRILAHGIRYHVFVHEYGQCQSYSLPNDILVRAGSEFVALAFLPYFADQAVRVAMLCRQGVLPGRATWITYLELIYDSLVSGILSLIAGVYALLVGAFLVATILLVLSVPIVVFFCLTLILSAKKGLHLPNVIFRLIERLFGKKRGKQITDFVNNTISVFNEVAKQAVNRSSLKVASKGLVLTLFVVLLPSLALWVIFNFLGNGINFIASVFTTNASTTLALIPITLGGSGLTELGINFYTMNVLGFSNWNGVIGWRIATYFVPLTFCMIALSIMLYKLKKQSL